MNGVELSYEELCALLIFSSDEDVKKGFYVSEEVFRRFYLERQNTVIRKGRVMAPTWVHLSGGVYKVVIDQY